MIKINAQGKDEYGEILINLHPDTCPHCHYSVVPVSANASRDEDCACVGYFCPRNECGRYFIYEYYEDGSDYFYLDRPINGTARATKYSETISDISSGFVEIYGQAEQAENIGLTDICGVGYRKALEFLIKDYIIHTNPELKGTVEGKLLAQCIGEHIENKKIVDIAKRAVWLGNVETHYVRKWEGMDINHLKQLIALTVHWIETEELTNKMILGMPDPKNRK